MRELIIFIVLLVPALVAYLWWKLFNSPSGERYMKMRIQGPFVPADDDEAQIGQLHVNGSPKPELNDPTQPAGTTMSSKEQANSAADALLVEANRTRIQNIPKVPRLFRVQVLNTLEPRRRLEVVKQAGKNVNRNPRFILIALALCVPSLLMWVKGVPESYHGIFQTLSLSAGLLIFALNIIWVRREISRLVNTKQMG